MVQEEPGARKAAGFESTPVTGKGSQVRVHEQATLPQASHRRQAAGWMTIIGQNVGRTHRNGGVGLVHTGYARTGTAR